MKRRRRLVALIIAAVLLIGIAVFAYVQRSNLKALLMSIKYSEDDLQSLQNDVRQELIEKFGLNPEVLEQIDSQTPSFSGSDPGSSKIDLPDLPDLSDDPQNKDSADLPDEKTDTATVLPSGNGKKSELPKTDKLPKDVQKLIYSLYSLQSQYLGRLDGIRAAAIAQYEALPDSDKGTSAQISIAKAGVSQAMSLEGQCDGRVASLIREIRAALRKHGLDESIAGSVEDYYATQKGLVKAEYMRKYNKYLK